MSQRLYPHISARLVVWSATFIVLALLAIQPAIISYAAGPDNDIWWNPFVLHDSRDTLYRNPGGAAPINTNVTLRLRVAANDLTQAQIRIWNDKYDAQSFLPMVKIATDGTHDWYAGVLNTGPVANIFYYRFILTDGTDTDLYEDHEDHWGGAGQMYEGTGPNSDESPDHSWALTVYDPAFSTPDWVKNAVFYQVFVDRFRDGNASNNPAAGGFFYGEPASTIVRSNGGDWNEPLCDPRTSDNPSQCFMKYSQNFYGGDLQGIIDKLPYLDDLGVTALYLNPIFESPSNHKYDTSDFSVIDDNFGDLAKFQELVAAADALGINIVLDGVFNHASSMGPYFDRYSQYPSDGACESLTSPWIDMFQFIEGDPTPTCSDNRDYPYWFGIFDSLAVLNNEGDFARDAVWGDGITHPSGLTEAVGKYWIEQGAAGWRLDVAPEVDDGAIPAPGQPVSNYWDNFRAQVHSVDPEAYIVGEEWGMSQSWTSGGVDNFTSTDGNPGEWDATMNYQQSAALLSFWRDSALSDAENDFNTGSSAGQLTPLEPSQFVDRYLNLKERYSPEAFAAMLNLLGSHDTQRALWLLDHGHPLTPSEGEIYPPSPNHDWSDALQRLRGVALMQFTLEGAPQIYYGDEIGLVAPATFDGTRWQDDPYNRIPYPWADESGTPYYDDVGDPVAQAENYAFYQSLAAARNSHPALRTGDIEFLVADDANNKLAYMRQTSNGSDTVIVLINRSGVEQDFTEVFLNVKVETGAQFDNALTPAGETYTVDNDGEITVNDVPANTGVLLVQTSAVVLPPAAPTNLVATEDGFDVDLTWDSTGSSHYMISRSLLSGGGYEHLSSSTTNSYTDTTASPGTTYYYVVRSFHAPDGLESGYSNEDSAQTQYDVSTAYRNIQWPPSLTHTISTEDVTDNVYGQIGITGVTDTQSTPVDGISAQLGWGPLSSNPTGAGWEWVDMIHNPGYDFGQSRDEFQGALLPDQVGTFSYTVRYSGDGGATWHYATDFNSCDEASQSGYVLCTLTVNASSDSTPPTAPTLVKDYDTNTEVGLSWSGASDETGLSRYRIYRDGNLIAELDDSVSSYEDSSVTTGSSYDYAVTAVDTSYNESDPSNTVTATAETSMVDVQFIVAAPSFTPAGSTVQVIGGASQLTNWGAGVDMTPTGDPNEHSVTLQFEEGSSFEYKYRRDGVWTKVEKAANGNTEISNREYLVGYAEDGPFVIEDTVANWVDVLVSATTPADGATGVAVDSTVAVSFNKAVNTGSDFDVTDLNGDAVAGTFAVDNSGTPTATFTPDADLCVGAPYSVDVSGVSGLVEGSQLHPYTFDFTTAGDPVDVTFNVTVPAFTPDADSISLYVQYGSGPAGTSHALTEGAPGVWSATIPLTDCLDVSVYAHRGSPDTVETDAATGLTAVTHPVTIAFGLDGTQTVDVTVENWLDVLVTGTSPLDGATEVATDSNILVMFNKDVFISSEFTVTDGAGAVSGTFSVDNASTPTITFDPDEPFCRNDEISVNVAGIQGDENPAVLLAPYTFDFNTVADADVDVTFTVTVPGFTPDGDTIYIDSDHPAFGTGVALTEGTPGVWSGTVTGLSDCANITVFAHRGAASTFETDAATGLAAVTHPVTVTYGADGTQAVSFTVGNWEDPIVTAVSPADGATGVAIDTNVQVTFNKNVNATPNFEVRDHFNNPVPGTFSYTAVTNTMTFDPTNPLLFEETYTVDVDDIVSVDAVTQIEDSVTTFTTTKKIIAVTWTVTVPSFTPAGSTVYISGNHPLLGSDDLDSVAMTNSAPTTWTFTGNFLEDTVLTYTFSRGTENTRATQADGETLITGTFTVDGSGGMTQSRNDTIGNWRDPIILNFSPADGATQQAVNTPISVTFSKPIHGSTTFTVINSDSAAVLGTYSVVGATVTFTPSPDYRFADTITATISAVDGAGSGEQLGTLVIDFKTEFFELLDNGSFEDDARANKILPWKQVGKSGDKRKCTNAPVITGSCAFKFAGSPLENSILKQNIDFSDAPFVVGDELILAAYLDSSSAVKLNMIIIVTFDDAPKVKSVRKATPTVGYVLFSAPTVTLPSTNVKTIKVQFKHYSKSGRTFIDDVSLMLRQGNARRDGSAGPLAAPSVPSGFRGN